LDFFTDALVSLAASPFGFGRDWFVDVWKAAVRGGACTRRAVCGQFDCFSVALSAKQLYLNIDIDFGRRGVLATLRARLDAVRAATAAIRSAYTHFFDSLDQAQQVRFAGMN
jgi:hypothetical protein